MWNRNVRQMFSHLCRCVYDIDTVEDVDLLRGHLATLEITQPEFLQELVQTRRALDVITKGRHYTPRP